MRKTGMRWGGVAGAVVVLAGLGGAAQAQELPPGCAASGNANNAAAGALIGGVAGALLGNAVSGRRKEGGTIIGGVTGALAGAAIGGGTGVEPCPQGYAYRAVPERDDERPLRRIRGDDPPPRHVRDDDVWFGAPPSIHERIAFMRHRVAKLDADGWLSPRESDGLRQRLGEITEREERVRDNNDGHLPPEMRARLDDDLNEVARRLRWKEYRTRHAEE